MPAAPAPVMLRQGRMGMVVACVVMLHATGLVGYAGRLAMASAQASGGAAAHAGQIDRTARAPAADPSTGQAEKADQLALNMGGG